MATEAVGTRRGVLRSLAGVLGIAAGCLSPKSTTPAGSSEPPTTGPPTDRVGPTDAPATKPSRAPIPSPRSGSGLDLREANVVGVEVERRPGSVRFAVTLYHDDDGEPGYADWWQVETLEGERVGRRELLHPHSTAPFTRSASFEVPEGQACFVVRGHDRTHGYGGRAMLVDLEAGATRDLDQGTEPRAPDPDGCP